MSLTREDGSSEAAASYLQDLSEALHDPGKVESLVRVWGEKARAGLEFHVSAARRRRLSFVAAIYPRLWRVLAAPLRAAVSEKYLAQPSGVDRDWNRNAQGLLPVLEQLALDGQLAGGALALARHEWSLFESSLHEDVPPPGELGGALVPNPTLHVMEHSHDMASWLSNTRAGGWPQECQGPQRIAYFMHPTSCRGAWLPLDGPRLGRLKLVSEGGTVEEMAARAGASAERLGALLQQEVARGLLVADEACQAGV